MKNLLLYSGYFRSYRDLFEKAGGVAATFPKGIDVFPYLQKNNLCIYIDDGWLDMRMTTSGMEVYEATTFGEGSFLYSILRGTEGMKTYWELIPYSAPLKGLLLPQKNLNDLLKQHPVLLTACWKATREMMQILMFNTALFHTGSGIERVCNFLWYYDALRTKDNRLPHITQDKIMYKTLLSKSQLTRVLSQLRQQGLIQTRYCRLEIIDKEALQKHISESILEWYSG